MSRSQHTYTGAPVVWVHLPASWSDDARKFQFRDPGAVWAALEIDQVGPALERVESSQRDGLFVAGFVRYEAAPAFDRAMATQRLHARPLAWFAAFEKPETISPWEPAEICAPALITDISEEEYAEAVCRCLDHIRAGDIYQVNYTIRSRCTEPPSNPWPLFQSLFAAVPMPHAAYMDTGKEQILSLSPELFLRRRGNVIESRPMKGTAKREPSWDADEAARKALETDEKNRAENIMIVDLVRNDLGRVCKAGSIHVPELCHADRHPTVHQMTSLVCGELRDGVSLADIFAATFPPGSVTGAPKIRAMKIISELENEARGIYCGTIGLFFPGGDFECNVAIRTLEILPEERFGVLGIGSGIVADSMPSAEWEECLLKSRFLSSLPESFALYETIRWEPRSGFRDLHLHLRRLSRSCRYFGRPFPLAAILASLREFRGSSGDTPCRLRLDIDETGIKVQSSRENLAWPENGMIVVICNERVDPTDVRLYHKTTLRPERYAALETARSLGGDETLFVNTRDEITEGALSNILVRIGKEWLTPAVSSGLLPGVGREFQLASGRCREAVLTLDDLKKAREIRMINAVRGEGVVRAVLDPKGHQIYCAWDRE